MTEYLNYFYVISFFYLQVLEMEVWQILPTLEKHRKRK